MALTENKQKVINLLVLGTMKKTEIAKEVGITPQAISYMLREPEFQAALRAAQLEVEQIYRMERIKTARKVAEHGLKELERRLKPDKAKYEKTNHIIDAVVKCLSIVDETLGVGNTKGKTNPNDVPPTSISNEGVDMNNDKFRSGLRQLLKGKDVKAVSGLGTKKSFKKRK